MAEPTPSVLADALRRLLGGPNNGDAAVENLSRLSGGASRQTWAFDLVPAAGEPRPRILRLDPPGAEAGVLAREAALIRAAHDAGVPVPSVVALGDASGPFGRDFLVMERVAGETIPRRILRDTEFAGARPRLARQCGQILAAIHRIRPDTVRGLDGSDPLHRWRTALDETGEPHPAFELAFRWLQENRPARTRTTVVHGDFRNGNLIIGPEGVRAVLDWELAHVGDPLEDLGWLCVKAWRFGSQHPVGGFGSYAELLDGYRTAGGGEVDREALRWWEIFGTLKWGIICIVQARRHLTGTVRSVELAALGRRVCENEWDLLRMI